MAVSAAHSPAVHHAGRGDGPQVVAIGADVVHAPHAHGAEGLQQQRGGRWGVNAGTQGREGAHAARLQAARRCAAAMRACRSWGTSLAGRRTSRPSTHTTVKLAVSKRYMPAGGGPREGVWAQARAGTSRPSGHSGSGGAKRCARTAAHAPQQRPGAELGALVGACRPLWGWWGLRCAHARRAATPGVGGNRWPLPRAGTGPTHPRRRAGLRGWQTCHQSLRRSCQLVRPCGLRPLSERRPGPPGRPAAACKGSSWLPHSWIERAPRCWMGACSAGARACAAARAARPNGPTASAGTCCC